VGNPLLSHLTITGGTSGGIYVGAGSLSLDHVVVRDNSSGNGGGIYVSGGTLTVVNSIISGNSAMGSSGKGGGIYSTGSITITNSTVSGNSARNIGGGIYSIGSSATVSISNSTVSGNTAVAGCGGIYNGTGALTVTSSTISNNSATNSSTLGNAVGGGIGNFGIAIVINSTISGNSVTGTYSEVGGGIYSTSSMTLINSTVTANSTTGTSSGRGGGIYSTGSMTLVNSTVTANSASYSAGGVYLSGNNNFLHNTVIAGNVAANYPQAYGTVRTYSSHNLISYGVGLSGITNGANGNQIGVGTPIDPMLGPLQDNGGPTWTHAPLPGSPLIDAGNDAQALDAKGKPLLVDQRGFVRRFGTVDIGAVESQPLGIPGAYDDGFFGDQDNLVVLDVLDNDTCSDGSPMTAILVTLPAHGVLEGNQDGTWTYTPDAGFWGTDMFSYRAVNGEFQSNTAQVFVSVFSPTSIIVTTADDEVDGDLSPGDISLREAIAMATPGSTIQFSAAMLNQVIKLTYSTTATLAIADVQIIGPGASFLTIDGNSRGTVFRATGGNSLLSHLTVTGGTNSGIIVSGGADLVLDNMVVTGNRSSLYGGGVFNNNGLLTVANSTVSRNSASDGGGVYSTGLSSDTSVLNSTVLGNSASYGGGICGVGAVTVSNSIVSGNTASLLGGGIFGSSTLHVANSTIAGNSAMRWGGGVYTFGGGILLNNSIIAVNTAPGEPDIRGSLAAGSGYNLIGIDPGFVRNPSPGGPDPGDLRLTEFSPAIDMGDTAAVPEGSVGDFDGNPRVVGARVDIGAYEFQHEIVTEREAASIVVTTLADTFDPYDGETSLREALFHAGHDGLDTAVAFDPALAGGTLTLDGQPLYIDHAARVDAKAIGSLVIDGDRRSRVLTVLSAELVELAALIVTGGAAEDGGGIANFGSLTAAGLSVVGNLATGITNGSATVGNVIVGSGGGLYNTGTLTMANSTIAGNANLGTAGSGGGVCIADGTMILTNSIIAANASPSYSNIWGTLDPASSHNLIGGDPGFVRNPSPGGDGVWGTADDDWGDLRLRIDGSAVNAGSNALAVDAQGNPLTVDLDGNPRVSGLIVDIGAYEYQFPRLPGDANGDGTVDADDATILAANWGATHVTLAGDANRDGVVDGQDARILAATWGKAAGANRREGDFDGDGAVGPKDSAILAAHWGRTSLPVGWNEGDFDGDGIVNAIDAAILAAHFGATVMPPGETTPGAPETPSVAETPSTPLPSVGPDVADATPLVGPLPIGAANSARQPIRPAERLVGMGAQPREQLVTQQREQILTQQRAYALRSPEAIDAVIGEEYGPTSVEAMSEETMLFGRHAAWARTITRRTEPSRCDAGDETVLAVDLLLTRRR
ncbi:MAG: cadherin-like domain-containing protein, partial [Pirellulaceae bacterium]|nr:cadherin-like domain-containing protein [Pirellulaceae bacterium]